VPFRTPPTQKSSPAGFALDLTVERTGLNRATADRRLFEGALREAATVLLSFSGNAGPRRLMPPRTQGEALRLLSISAGNTLGRRKRASR
jgi:hypothetical protein